MEAIVLDASEPKADVSIGVICALLLLLLPSSPSPLKPHMYNEPVVETYPQESVIADEVMSFPLALETFDKAATAKRFEFMYVFNMTMSDTFEFNARLRETMSMGGGVAISCHTTKKIGVEIKLTISFFY
jgi:hypothetical protein